MALWAVVATADLQMNAAMNALLKVQHALVGAAEQQCNVGAAVHHVPLLTMQDADKLAASTA